MKESIVGLQDKPQVEREKNIGVKIREFAASKEYVRLPAKLKDIAIEHSVFFASASDADVNYTLKDLYKSVEKGGSRASFHVHEKEQPGWESFDEVNNQYLDLYNSYKESDTLTDKEIKDFCLKQKRIDVAARVARLDFAKALGYLPGGANDYESTIAKPEFKLAEKFVREAVDEFSPSAN